MSTKMKDLPLFYAPALREELQLPEGEAQHAIRVLRAKVGDEFLVTDGCGTLFETRVSGVDRRHCILSIEHEEPWQKYWRGHWAVAVAPTKNIDRLEWTLEKMVEVGLMKSTSSAPSTPSASIPAPSVWSASSRAR